MATKPVKKMDKSTTETQKSIAGDDLLSAIKSTFPEIQGKIYLCPLWADQDVHRFRINWYKGGNIVHSKFVHVKLNPSSKKTKNKLTIEEK